MTDTWEARVHIPAASPAPLRAAVGRALTTATALRVEISLSWEGPHLRIVGPVGVGGPKAAGALLADIARGLTEAEAGADAEADAGAAPRPRPPAPPPGILAAQVATAVRPYPPGAVHGSPAEVGAQALRRLLRSLGRDPRADLAVLLDDGLVGVDGAPTPLRPKVVLDSTRAPTVPDGWLLQSWTCLAADAVHCAVRSVRGRPTLCVTAPQELVPEPRLDLYAAVWADALLGPGTPAFVAGPLRVRP
ncbi:hypothetical protein [Streptomyces sp. NPDC006645]|uniref:hypothetical protein n=1 Tax=unclassified Streptomyces TaxID=2593676 RepID=UPI0033B5BD2D